MKRWSVSVGLLAWIWSPMLLAAGLDDSLQAMQAANRETAASEQRISELQQQTDTMAEEYRRLTQGADSQQAQAQQLDETLAQQDKEIASLRQQLASRATTQERIVPLMRSMVEALEQFVALDLPFHQEDRLGRVQKIKQQLATTSVNVQEKYRAVLSGFQQELEYGRTLETWRGELALGQENLTVELCRIGRVAFYFQTMDGQRAGCWDRTQKQWVELAPAQSEDIRQAMRIARNQLAPQLLSLPFPAPEAVAATPVATEAAAGGE